MTPCRNARSINTARTILWKARRKLGPEAKRSSPPPWFRRSTLLLYATLPSSLARDQPQLFGRGLDFRPRVELASELGTPRPVHRRAYVGVSHGRGLVGDELRRA